MEFLWVRVDFFLDIINTLSFHCSQCWIHWVVSGPVMCLLEEDTLQPCLHIAVCFLSLRGPHYSSSFPCKMQSVASHTLESVTSSFVFHIVTVFTVNSGPLCWCDCLLLWLIEGNFKKLWVVTLYLHQQQFHSLQNSSIVFPLLWPLLLNLPAILTYLPY